MTRLANTLCGVAAGLLLACTEQAAITLQPEGSAALPDQPEQPAPLPPPGAKPFPVQDVPGQNLFTIGQGSNTPRFGGPGPWPIANRSYGFAEGILETPIVGHSTDEFQNRWVATREAIYLLQPGQSTFRRFDASDGLHLKDNPVAYCDSNFGGGDRSCPIYGAASDLGITELIGGGPNEVFVGYAGVEESTGDWGDLNRHSGKLDRVRLRADGTLQVDRIDFVANAHGAQYWHNRTVQRLVFDHFIHRHELYVGMNHGVVLLRPDQYRAPKKGEWFDDVNMEYMADHLHARVCFHAPCDQTTSNQRMGDWRGLALSPDGHLWTAGKWTAGKIAWHESLRTWFSRGGDLAFLEAFGDPYPLPPDGNGFINEPVFRPPEEGDPVHLSAVTVAPDGRVWFASDPGTSADPAYGVAVWDGKRFEHFSPSALGLSQSAVIDLVALPDGRLVLAAPDTGLVLYDPATGAHQALRGSQYLADDHVRRLELDLMVQPPALHVSTDSGASVIRVFP